MGLVSKMCPKLRKMMFQLNNELVPDVLSVFLPFKNLQELHHWGGDFYTDKLNLLIERIGQQLKSLYFIHVDELDLASLGQYPI